MIRGTAQEGTWDVVSDGDVKTQNKGWQSPYDGTRGAGAQDDRLRMLACVGVVPES